MSLVEVKSAEASFKDSILLLQDIFSHFDKLGSEGSSGAITTEKLGEALRDSLGLGELTEPQLRDMVAAVDLNASGDIQFNEFLKMMDQAKHDADLMQAQASGAEGEDEEDQVDDGEQKEDSSSSSSGSAKAGAAASKAAAFSAAAAAAAKADAALQAESEYVMTRDDIKAIFQVFDEDRDGRISAAELQNMLKAQGEKYTEEEVHAMVTRTNNTCAQGSSQANGE